MRICANPKCGKPFARRRYASGNLSPAITCSRSCANALSWLDPEKTAKRLARISERAREPHRLAITAAHNLRRWAKPEEHARLSEQNRREWADPEKAAKRTASIKAVHGQPHMRAFYSALRTEQWKDPEFRARTTAGIRASKGTPEARAKFSALLRAHWKDPAWRLKWMLGMQRRMARAEEKAAVSERMRKRWETDRKGMLALSRAAHAKLQALWDDPVIHEALAAKLADARAAARAKKRGAFVISANQVADVTAALIIDSTGKVRAA